MKFEYEYRTSDNVRHSGVVVAPDRESAFQLLKAQGIRPGFMREAPGFFNWLFGKGKRWVAIVVLAVSLVVALAFLFEVENDGLYAAEDRAQVFGDPAVLQKLAKDGWRVTFPDPGEAWLARHAIPGKLCDCELAKGTDEVAAALLDRKDRLLRVNDADPEELKKMKRIVNGMKREFSDYVTVPADVREYMAKACERCRVEKGIAENVAREIVMLERNLERDEDNRKSVLLEWDKKNATLRSIGLPTVPQPE